MMAERFPFIDIRDMDLYYWQSDGSHRISQSYRGVGISAGVHHNAVIFSHRFMKLVDKDTFMIGLKRIDDTIRKSFFQRFQIIIKRLIAIHFRLTFSDKVQIWTVKYQNLHNQAFILTKHL